MTKADPEELFEIDPDRFEEFYRHFPDGRGAAAGGTNRLGAPSDIINSELRKQLGDPPQSGKRGRPTWLGAKSSLEEWANKTTTPRPKERKVLQAIYDTWGFDISRTQEFLNRIAVHPDVADILQLDGIKLAVDPFEGGPMATLRIHKVEIIPQIRTLDLGRQKLPPARASLGFSQVSITLALSGNKGNDKGEQDLDAGLRVMLEALFAGNPHQYGSANGLHVLCDPELLEWKIIKAQGTDAGVFIVGNLRNALLLELRPDLFEHLKIKVETEKKHFDPIVHLEEPTKDADENTRQKHRHKQQLLANILKGRLNGGERYVLAEGRLWAR